MDVAERVSREEELLKKLESNRVHRRQKLALENEFMRIRLEHSKVMKQHYEEHYLKVDLKSYQWRMESLLSRSRHTANQTSMRRLNDYLKREFDKQNKRLDTKMADLSCKLDQYKRLDGRLLADYQKLKEDLDCQNLLIEMSGGNVDKLLSF